MTEEIAPALRQGAPVVLYQNVNYKIEPQGRPMEEIIKNINGTTRTHFFKNLDYLQIE